MTFKTEGEQVPTPSLKTRPFLSTSGITFIALLGSVTELKVCEKACPILAAHFAGDWILVKSPRLAMSPLAKTS